MIVDMYVLNINSNQNRKNQRISAIAFRYGIIYPATVKHFIVIPLGGDDNDGDGIT